MSDPESYEGTLEKVFANGEILVRQAFVATLAPNGDWQTNRAWMRFQSNVSVDQLDQWRASIGRQVNVTYKPTTGGGSQVVGLTFSPGQP